MGLENVFFAVVGFLLGGACGWALTKFKSNPTVAKVDAAISKEADKL